MSAQLRRLLLQAALSNQQTEATDAGYRTRCLHCRTWLCINTQGAALGAVTLEHIIPQAWFDRARALDQLFAHADLHPHLQQRPQSANDLANLALACERCNQAKGRSHDRYPLEEKSQQVIRALFLKRILLWQGLEQNA